MQNALGEICSEGGGHGEGPCLVAAPHGYMRIFGLHARCTWGGCEVVGGGQGDGGP